MQIEALAAGRRLDLKLDDGGDRVAVRIQLDRWVACEQCGLAVVGDPHGSSGVWVHDPDRLDARAWDLNADHAARPPEGVA